MKSDAPLTADVLRTLLRYEPETGRLFWLQRSEAMFPSRRHWLTWITRYAGKEAFMGTNDHGYRRGSIFDRDYRAHRVIWALMTGDWPIGEIDHANGDRADNRWVNLRVCSRSENLRNRQSRPGATSQFLGVSKRSSDRKWRANIVIEGRQTHLGSFAEEQDAARAYDAAARQIHGEFARPNFPEAA